MIKGRGRAHRRRRQRAAVHQIQVNVTHGEVTLAGTVDTSEAWRRAEDVAGSIAGVVSVMNDLRVRQPGGTGATG
jgi:osmotically-inducible protein OsmY